VPAAVWAAACHLGVAVDQRGSDRAGSRRAAQHFVKPAGQLLHVLYFLNGEDCN
jgi:hypothetical protein